MLRRRSCRNPSKRSQTASKTFTIATTTAAPTTATIGPTITATTGPTTTATIGPTTTVTIGHTTRAITTRATTLTQESVFISRSRPALSPTDGWRSASDLGAKRSVHI